MPAVPVLAGDPPSDAKGYPMDPQRSSFTQIKILQGIRVVLDGLNWFLDVVWSEAALVVDMPLMLLLWLLGRMATRSPVLFRQERVAGDTRGRSRW
jgi:lipopolysaccharide/colanic/teichoic acid biosynthesis glycosyltransferase